jgi:protein-disulfide isomerase
MTRQKAIHTGSPVRIGSVPVKSLTKPAMAGIGVVVVAALAATYYFTRPGMQAVALSGPATVAEDRLMQPGPLGEMVLGDPTAPVTVIEYASMTCSHCANFHRTVYGPFKEKYIDTGKVRFIFREYPLEPLATAAIIVARCGSTMRFFPTVDLLFNNQRQWAGAPNPVEAMYSLVKQTGLTREQYDACLADQKLLDGVNAVHDRANQELGVTSTPTFFINGKIYPGEMTLDEISGLVDQQL